MAKRKSSGLSSGDKLVDCFFNLITETLHDKKVIRGIHKVNNLRDPDDNRVVLCGFCESGSAEGSYYIYLNADKRKNPTENQIAITLLHEACHAIMPYVIEDYILDLEMLWKRFSLKQREALKFFIPKNFSKKDPQVIEGF